MCPTLLWSQRPMPSNGILTLATMLQKFLRKTWPCTSMPTKPILTASPRTRASPFLLAACARSNEPKAREEPANHEQELECQLKQQRLLRKVLEEERKVPDPKKARKQQFPEELRTPTFYFE